MYKNIKIFNFNTPPPIKTQASTSSGPTTSSNVTEIVTSAKKRRNRKQRLRKNGIEAILISNLPPLLCTNDIENIIQQTTGLNRLNSPFYIELRKTPHMVEALIKFLNPSHSMMAFEKLQSFGYKVIAPNEPTLNYINNGFIQRSMQHMAAITANQSHPYYYYNKIANKMCIPNNSINEMSRHVQYESATGNVSNANTQGHFPMNVSNIMDNPTTSLPNFGAKETIEGLDKTSINYKPDCRIDMASINAHESFSQEREKDDFSKNVTTENISNKNLQKLSTNNESNVIIETINETPNYLEKAIKEESSTINNAIDDSEVVKHERTDFHDNDDDEGNDSTSTFVLKEEPIDFNELSTIHEESSNDDKTVEDYIIIRVHNIDIIKQERNKVNDDKISEDENNLAINELLDNFNPNEIEIKEEPVETNNPEVLPETLDLIKQEPKEINDDKISEDENNLAIIELLDNLNPNEKEIKEEPVETNNPELSPETIDLIKQEPNEINNNKISKDKNNLAINELLDNFNPNEIEIKEEPVETNNPEVLPETLDLIKQEPKEINDDKISEDKNNLAINELLDNLNPNEIEIKEEPVETNNPEVSPETNIVVKDMEKSKQSKNSLNSNSEIESKPVSKRRPEFEYDAPAEPPKRRRKQHHQNNNVDHQNIEDLQNIDSSSKNASIPNNKKEDQILLEYGFRSEFLQNLGLRTPLTNTIDVNQLHERVDKEKLYEVFSLAGDVKQIHFNCEKHSAKIEFDHPVEAVQAIFMFREQTLFEKEICIEMDYRPKSLPVGLSGMNKGFNKYGKPLRGVRTNIELRDVHEILHELGKMDKFEPLDQYPFGTMYVKRDKSTKSTCPDSPTISLTTVPITNTTNNTLTENCDASFDMDLSSNEDSNEKSEPAVSNSNTQVIEQLGALLKSRGIIPNDLNCKDAKSILDAIQGNSVNRNENENVDNDSENTKQTPRNVLPNSTNNGTQSYCAPNTTSNAFDVPPSFIPQSGQSQHTSVNQNGNNNVDNDSQNMPTYALPNVAYGTQYFTQGIPNTMSFPAPPSLPPYEPLSGPAVAPNVSQSHHVVPPNVLQPGHVVPSNVPQSCYAVQPNVPQSGHAVSPNVPQSGHAVPTNIPQSGHAVPPNVPQSAHAVPPNVPQSGHAVPPNVPQSGYAVQSNVPQSGYAVQPNVPQSGHVVPPNVPQSAHAAIPFVPPSVSVPSNVPQSAHAAIPFIPPSVFVPSNVPQSANAAIPFVPPSVFVPPNVPQSAHAAIPFVPPSVSAVPPNVPPSGRCVPQFEPPTGQAVSKPGHGSEQRNKTVQQNTESRDPRLRSRVVDNSPKRRQEDRSSSGVDKGIKISPKKSRECSRLIFRNLPLGVSQAELSEKMREVGGFLYCEGPTNGLAIVAFSSLQDAKRCLRLFHRAKVDGQVIDVIAVS